MNLKRNQFLIIVCGLALVGFLLYRKQAMPSNQVSVALGATHTINLTKQGFVPDEIAIHQGDTVIFTTTAGKAFWPASNLHPTHAIYPEFDPKREIKPGDSWSFVFNKPGTWYFHDHLSPTNTGSIVVAANGAFGTEKKVKAAVGNCANIDKNKKQQCWDEQLQRAVKEDGLDAAFELFVELYKTDPEIPKACHGWAHILGKAAFEKFKDQKEIILRKETSYCGYGFFHGFIERLLQTSGDIKQTKAFCEYATKQLGSLAGGTYSSCVHGIGHGSVNIDNPALWGDFGAMISPGFKTCEAALDSPQDLRNCYDGAFNAMQQNAYHKDYKLSVDPKDVYAECRKQEQKYKISCYFEFTGLTSEFSGHDFKKAAGWLLKEDISREIKIDSISKMAADFMQDDIAKASQKKNLLDCRSLPEYLRTFCFNGVLVGFLAHGQPEQEYIKGLNFCKDPLLTAQEEQACYSMIVGQTVKKATEACDSLPEKYKALCRA